jgi:hypothetical protein
MKISPAEGDRMRGYYETGGKMEIGKETIDGRTVKFEVDARTGKFASVIDGDEYSADTLEGLKAKLRTAFRKAKVRISVPATALDAELIEDQFGHRRSRREQFGKLRHFVITGIHGRTNRALIRWEDTGETEQLSHYASDIVRRLTKAEEVQYAKLAMDLKRAQDAREEFVEARRLSNKSDINEYIKEKIDEQIDQPADTDQDDTSEGDPRIAGKNNRPGKKRRS